MSGGEITRYVETSPSLARHTRTEAVKPPAVHPAWENLVSQRSARAVAVTSRSGRLWVATWGGVLSWHRKQDQCYLRHAGEHGLAGNGAACLALDQEDGVWAGHDEGGLSLFAEGRWHQYEDLAHEPIRALCAARGGGVWAAGPGAVYLVPGRKRQASVVARDHDGAVEADVLLPDGDEVLVGNAWGLFRLREGCEPEPVESETFNCCTALARDGHGDVWAATAEEVFRLRGSRLDPPTALPPEVGGFVRGLAVGKDVVWVWTSSGLATIADDHCRAVPWPATKPGEAAPEVRTIGAAGDDRFLWVGTDDRLAVAWLAGQEVGWDVDLLPAHPEDALNNLGRCAARGIDGGVWVGTAGGLVAHRPDGTWHLDPGAGDVRAVRGGAEGQREPGVLYLLAWPRGFGWRSGTGPVRFYSPQPDGIPQALALGQDGHLYTLTTRGLWKFKPGTPELVAEGPGVTATGLAQTADRTWWLGTPRGVMLRTAASHWELSGGQPGPGHAEVTGLVAVGETLWAGTTAGLWAHRGSDWVRHAAAGEVVRAMAPASDAGALWVAAEDRVVRYDSAGGRVLGAFGPRDSGLGSVRVTAMLEASGVLWTVTPRGVSRLTLDKGAPS